MDKRIFCLASVSALVLSVALSSCGGGMAETGVSKGDTGPAVDRIVFEMKGDLSEAVKDTAEGRTDILAHGMDAGVFQGISQADRDRLSVYAVPSGSWSYLVNPIPNEAPYVWKTADGGEHFNPLAIREVRYALNWLIDRKKIVDELLKGGGEVAFTAMPPGQPGTDRYTLLAAKTGMTERGDEERALGQIEKALEAAARLPELSGKLKKTGSWWTYRDRPVTVKFVIRADDPQGRLLAGLYVADQIEKAGIKVERLERDRSEADEMVYGGDPAAYQWTLYTEAWSAGATRRWWDVSISQMYAPYYGYMPGWADEGFWNYREDTIDALARKGYNGWFLTSEEYWNDNLKALELGLKDAVRIYVCSQTKYFAANKDRLPRRFAYGLADGFNGWSFITADVKPDEKGEKVLRAALYSAEDGFFASPWDPIGVDGFSDGVSSPVFEVCTMRECFEAPNSAADIPYLVRWDPKDVQTNVGPDIDGDDKPEGYVDVPPDALRYDPKAKAWVRVGPGVKSYSSCRYSVADSCWHDGTKIGAADFAYASAFCADWSSRDGEADRNYEEAYASAYAPAVQTMKGIVFDKGGSYTTYFDFNWPMDKDHVAYGGLLSPKAGNAGRPTMVAWTVNEALALMVAEGAASGTVYSVEKSPSSVEVDVASPACVADIKAKLNEMIEEKYVPASIRDYISADKAADAYRKALGFIDRYGHAYISNGPFFISRTDTAADSIELSAFRSGYPYKKAHWSRHFEIDFTRIESVAVPADARREQEAVVDVSVSRYTYPDDQTRPATKDAKVTVTLAYPSGAKVYEAPYVQDGTFRAVIPAADLGTLPAGSCAVVAESRLKDETPSVKTAVLVLF